MKDNIDKRTYDAIQAVMLPEPMVSRLIVMGYVSSKNQDFYDGIYGFDPMLAPKYVYVCKVTGNYNWELQRRCLS